MKNLKLALFSLAFSLLMFTSCTNDEPVVQDQQNTEESESITTALNQLSAQIDVNGNFTADNNPAGNVVFDFCFDFVYPLTLSYNNGTAVTVENLDELVDVILASNDQLFVSGIAFPFDVEVYNDDSGAIETETIEDEEEFIELLEDCDFDDFEACECFELYDPVCVEITDPSGETFIITYPNECFAACDGFDEDDFVEDCEEDYYSGSGVECFEFQFPLDIVLNDGTIVTINSIEDLGNALFGVYAFDFVYPFSVILEDGEVETVNGPEDIEDILEDCYGDFGDDTCEECENAPIDPVCIEVTSPSGETYTEVFPNLCFAECFGYTEADVVECEGDGNPGGSVCDEGYIASIFEECQTWEADVSGSTFEYLFNEDGTLEISSPNSGVVASGTWEIGYDTAQDVTFITLDTNSGNFTTVWFFINCDGEGNFEVITNGGAATNIASACD